LRDQRCHIQVPPSGAPKGSSAQGVRATPKTELDRLKAAIEVVAELMIDDPAYTQIFERLEHDIKIETTALSGQMAAQLRARALLRQRDTGTSSALSISSDPPSP